MKVNRMPAGGWPNIYLDYNCYYQKDPDAPLIQIQNTIYGVKDFKKYVLSTGKDVHSITADPMFMDPENGNYQLKPGSPCIDAGILTSNRVDFADKVVPMTKNQDIGAFEQ